MKRRRFLSGGSLVAARFAALAGAPIVFSRFLPVGWIPAAFAGETDLLPGKPGLRLLNDRPVNAETPAHLLDDTVTPGSRLFVRNNGLLPEKLDPDTWQLEITGEAVKRPLRLSLAELKSRYEQISLQLLLECGGNGRAEFQPPAPGNQWTLGAVGCPVWNGIRLADLLQDAGIRKNAVYLAYEGADRHLSGDPNKLPISRGLPIERALAAESMLAWGMNGRDLPPLHGYPLRLVFGGWPGSTSGKWLKRILIRDRVHDGPKMGGHSYRVPRFPVSPGAEVAEKDMKIIEAMPVKSLITFPETGQRHARSEALQVRGHAWAGDRKVSRVRLSIDFGQTWQNAGLTAPVNPGAWQHFAASLRFPAPGYYEVWASATDSAGISQPMVLPGWNPKGYLNNAAHRIAVYVV